MSTQDPAPLYTETVKAQGFDPANPCPDNYVNPAPAPAKKRPAPKPITPRNG